MCSIELPASNSPYTMIWSDMRTHLETHPEIDTGLNRKYLLYSAPCQAPWQVLPHMYSFNPRLNTAEEKKANDS